MVSTNTLCKKLLNVKTAVIEGADFHADGMALTISSSMPDLMYGTRMTARSAIKDADATTGRTLSHVSGGGWTGAALSLKYLMIRITLNARNMAACRRCPMGLPRQRLYKGL